MKDEPRLDVALVVAGTTTHRPFSVLAGLCACALRHVSAAIDKKIKVNVLDTESSLRKP
jgi:hypothetical protein